MCCSQSIYQIALLYKIFQVLGVVEIKKNVFPTQTSMFVSKGVGGDSTVTFHIENRFVIWYIEPIEPIDQSISVSSRR